MKKILIGIFILSSASLFAQDNKDNRVPDNVKNSFQKEYPNAQKPLWDNTNGKWHATYKDQDSRNADSYYNTDGRRIETHTAYKQGDLPSKVQENANKQYHSKYNTSRIDRPNSQPLYEIKLQSGSTTYMDANGRKRKYEDGH